MTEHAAPVVGKRPLIIACIEDHPKAMMLLHTARLRASEKNARWCAVYIDTPTRFKHEEEGSHERMLHLLTLAEQMGGEIIHLEAPTLEKGVASLLVTEGDKVSLLLVGGTEPAKGWRRFRSSPWKRVVAIACPHTPVEIIPLSGQHYSRSLIERLRLQEIKPRYLFYALCAVGVAYLCAVLLEFILPPALFRINTQNIGLLFMIACAFSAGRFGLLPGLVASVVSFLTVNYCFSVPYYTFKLVTVTDMLNMALFLSAALLISLFTSQTRGYAERAAKREVSTKALFTLYRIASNAFSRQQALEKLQRKLTKMLHMDVAFFLPKTLNPDQIELVLPADMTLGDADQWALGVCWRELKVTGLASPFNPGTSWRFEPMIAPGGQMGVMGIRPYSGNKLDPWFGRLVSAISDQTAAILEHLELERSMETTRIGEEREKLRAMLLSSVSHDLKTPLAGIMGSLRVYLSRGTKLAEDKQKELIETALEEAQRLESFITNILDMTRLESGQIKFQKEWQFASEFIRHVAQRMQHRMQRSQLTITCPEDLEVCMDEMMTGQVLQNLLDNASKYTSPDTPIEINAGVYNEEYFYCTVRDYGKGLPEENMQQAFDKYARLQKKDSQVAGTGLGLAICKAVIEAQSGTISVANHPEGGAMFTFTLPHWRKAKEMVDAA